MSRKMQELNRKMASYLTSLSYAPPEARPLWRIKIDNVKRQMREQEEIDRIEQRTNGPDWGASNV